MYNELKVNDLLDSFIKKKKMTKKSFAEYSNIAEQTLYRALKDGANPSSETIESLADALECTIDSFYDRKIPNECIVGHNVHGNKNKVSGNINSKNISTDTEKEVELLRSLLKEKEERLKDKDKMIEILMNKTKEQ